MLLQLEQQIAAAATLKDLHSITASQTALHKKLDILSKSVDTKVSHADMHNFVQTQRHQTGQLKQQLDAKVGSHVCFAQRLFSLPDADTCLYTQAAALTAASLKLAADLSALQHHQEAAEKSSYVALCDVHNAIDKVNAEAASAVDRLRSVMLMLFLYPHHVQQGHCLEPNQTCHVCSSGMSASTSEMRQSQTMQRSAMQQSVDAVQQEIKELRSSNNSLCSHVDTKADKEHLQQVRLNANPLCQTSLISMQAACCKHHRMPSRYVVSMH